MRRSAHLSKRTFKRLAPLLHRRLPFAVSRAGESASTVFNGRLYGRREGVVAEFDANGVSGQGCTCDEPCENVVYRVVSETSCPVRKSALCSFASRVQLSIADGVEELCDEPFSSAKVFHMLHLDFRLR